MGHLVPLAEGVDPCPALLVEAGGVENPSGDVGVGAVAGIGGRGGIGWSRVAGGRGQLEAESGGLVEQPASISRQARAASGGSFEVMAESPVDGVKFDNARIPRGVDAQMAAAPVHGGRFDLQAVLALLAPGAQAQEIVEWWDFLGGGDGVRMKQLISEFNAEHAGEIQINATTLDWGIPFYTKVQTAAAVGEGPDIMTYHASRIPLAVSQGTLAPITPEDLAAMGLSPDSFAPSTWEAVNVDGTTYAIPFDTHPIVLYYNKDMLEAAGLIGEDGLPTGLDGLENFNAALQTLKDNGAEWAIAQVTADGGFAFRTARGVGRPPVQLLPTLDESLGLLGGPTQPIQ